MKTTYYTFTTWNENAMAAGFGAAAVGAQQAVMVRQPEQKARPLGGDNVIDLAAWRSANLDEPQDQLAWDVDEPFEEEPPQPEPALEESPRRVRKSRRAALYAELASTLAVAGAALALILRVLMF